MMRSHALVTGASRGLGAAVALALLRRGWSVASCARGPLAAEIARDEELAPRCAHTRLDLADLGARREWAQEGLAPAALRGVERLALVNNAGLLGPQLPLLELEPGALEAVVATNLVAPLELAGFALRARGPRSLRIVNVSSGAATSPYPGWSAYCATKAALRMADLVLARELEEVDALAGRDVCVLTWAPGVIATRMQEEIRAADLQAFPRRARFVALLEDGLLARPEEPAAELAELLEREDLPRHLEHRFTPAARQGD